MWRYLNSISRSAWDKKQKSCFTVAAFFQYFRIKGKSCVQLIHLQASDFFVSGFPDDRISFYVLSLDTLGFSSRRFCCYGLFPRIWITGYLFWFSSGSGFRVQGSGFFRTSAPCGLLLDYLRFFSFSATSRFSLDYRINNVKMAIPFTLTYFIRQLGCLLRYLTVFIP